jgi:hypothetical protein
MESKSDIVLTVQITKNPDALLHILQDTFSDGNFNINQIQTELEIPTLKHNFHLFQIYFNDTIYKFVSTKLQQGLNIINGSYLIMNTIGSGSIRFQCILIGDYEAFKFWLNPIFEMSDVLQVDLSEKIGEKIISGIKGISITIQELKSNLFTMNKEFLLLKDEVNQDISLTEINENYSNYRFYIKNEKKLDSRMHLPLLIIFSKTGEITDIFEGLKNNKGILVTTLNDLMSWVRDFDIEIHDFALKSLSENLINGIFPNNFELTDDVLLIIKFILEDCSLIILDKILDETIISEDLIKRFLSYQLLKNKFTPESANSEISQYTIVTKFIHEKYSNYVQLQDKEFARKVKCPIIKKSEVVQFISNIN